MFDCNNQLQLVVELVGYSTLCCLKFSPNLHGGFVTVENPGSDNLKSSMVIPSPTIIDRVLKDLFHEGTVYLHLNWLLCNAIDSHC